MNFHTYEHNVKEFLNNNYTNLINIPVGNSEEDIQSFINGEFSSISSYTRGLFKEIRRDAERYFDERYGPEQADELIELFKNSLPKVLIKRIQLEKSPELELEQRIEKYVAPRRVSKETMVSGSVIAGSGGAILVANALDWMVPSNALDWMITFKNVIIVGVAFVIAAGMTYTIIKFLDEKGKAKEVRIKGSESPINTYSKGTSTRGELKRNTIEAALAARHKEMEVKLLKAISDSEKQFEKLVHVYA